MEITINNQAYTIKYTLRAIFLFEKISDKVFELKSLLDHYIFFYSLLLASNKDKFNLTFDEFIEQCDNEPELFNSYLKFITNHYNIQEQLSNNEDVKEENSDKKKD